MTCSLDVRVPLLKVFCAKEMTVLGAARPGTRAVENAAACASSACDRFWSTEYNCMNPLTSCGL